MRVILRLILLPHFLRLLLALALVRLLTVRNKHGDGDASSSGVSSDRRKKGAKVNPEWRVDVDGHLGLGGASAAAAAAAASISSCDVSCLANISMFTFCLFKTKTHWILVDAFKVRLRYWVQGKLAEPSLPTVGWVGGIWVPLPPQV